MPDDSLSGQRCTFFELPGSNFRRSSETRDIQGRYGTESVHGQGNFQFPAQKDKLALAQREGQVLCLLKLWLKGAEVYLH